MAINNETVNSISIMTFNLRFGLADDGDNSWENRQTVFPDFFKTYTPDFIGFQESNNFQSHFLKNLLTDYSFIGMRDPSPEYWQNNLIFYKKSWTCLEHRHCFLSETPDVESKLSESQWPRQCVIGLFEKEGQQLFHVNTHFDFKGSVQKRSAELVTGFLSEYADDIPVVITGDFNSPPETPAYDIFMNNGFRDVFEGRHSSTFHGFTGDGIGEHIDWILFRGLFTVKNATIIIDSFSGIYPSDHFPVIASLKLRG